MRSVYAVYALSGFVSLGYQVAWFRIFVDRFGSTNLTFALVVSSFIGGLGVGSLASRSLALRLGRIAGLESPLRVYGLVELLIAATALLTLLLPLIPADLWGTFPYELVDGVHRPTAAYSLFHVGATILCVFLPCVLMGVTFPLLCHAFRDHGRFPAALYGWNTLGACTGILICEFLLLPSLGHDGTFLLMAAINAGLGAVFLWRRGEGSTFGDLGAAPARSAASFTASAAIACAAVSGSITGAFEADVLRRLQFVNCRDAAALSCISFWAILAIFCAAWTVRALPRLGLPTIKGACVVALVGYFVLWGSAYDLRDWANAEDLAELRRSLPPDTTGLRTSYLLSYFAYGLGATLRYTGLFVFPAFYLFSLLLPYLCNAAQGDRRHLGTVYGVNTVAFCAGMLAFTCVAPRVDVFYSLELFFPVCGVLVLLLLSIRPRRPLGAPRAVLACALIAAAAAATPAGFDPDLLAPGAVPYPVRALKSNGTHTTYVVEHPAGDVLYFDSHSMSGFNMPSQRYMRLMAHFPLLACEAPRRALLICFGVGNTAAAIADHREIEAVDVVELNDQVLATAPEFAKYHRVTEDPRLRLIHDDGRRFLDLTDEKYDLITSEPPPPMFAGMHRLYSVEYYEAARARLTEGGMMSQWLPIGQMPRTAMERAVATFLAVFPDALLLVGDNVNLVLVGGTAPVDLARIERRFGEDPRPTRDLRRLGIPTPLHLLARILRAAPSLRRQFGGRDVLSDQGVGFSRLYIDPRDRAVVDYDPVELLEKIDADELACGSRLRETLLDLGRLKLVVPDFPVDSLLSVGAGGVRGVARAGLDWHAVELLCTVAEDAKARGELRGATAFLATALERDDALPHVVHEVARIQSLRGEHTLALNAWTRLVELEPESPMANLGLAETLSKLGRNGEAVVRLKNAIARDPGLAPLHRALGEAQSALSRWRDALASFETALSLDPEDERAEEGRRRCREKL